MELYQVNGQIEQRLSIKADMAKIPLGGTMELSPLCNMDCEMCYVRKNKASVEHAGGLLSVEQWLHIAQQLKKMGTLFLLLTGGEPLLYPHFKELYISLHKMGFIIQINTNGTLITDEMVSLFNQYRPRQLNITMYGASDKTYQQLCHNSKGFTSLTAVIEKLQEKNIPVRITCSLTPHNIQDLEEIIEFVQERGLEFSPNEYMFPPMRKNGDNSERFLRFTPQECAQVRIRSRMLMYPDAEMEKQCELLLRKIENTQPLPEHRQGFQCRAGRSGFWINWEGNLLACGMMDNPSVSLKEYSFEEAWRYIVFECSKLVLCEKCRLCKKRTICNTCIAACYVESNGEYDCCPQYLCDMSDEMVHFAQKTLLSSNKNS